MRRYFVRVTMFQGEPIEFYITAVSPSHAEDQVRAGFEPTEVFKIQICAAQGEVA